MSICVKCGRHHEICECDHITELEAALERAVADGVLMKAQMQSAAQYAVGVAAERDMAMDDGAGWRGALEKLAWETVADKGGSEASVCRLCGGVLDHVPDCILSTNHPGAGIQAVMEAAQPLFDGMLKQYQAWINSPVYCHGAPAGNSSTDIPNSLVWRIGEALNGRDDHV